MAERISITSDGVRQDAELVVTVPLAFDYATVAASQTAQTLGATGAKADVLERLIVVPASTSPGNVQIKDGSNSAITIFAGGSSSVTSLAPITVLVGAKSTAGAWQVTTGANVSVIAVGNFT